MSKRMPPNSDPTCQSASDIVSISSTVPKEKVKKKGNSSQKLRTVDHIKISDISELMIKYEIGEEIGKGAFGVVIRITDKFTEMHWAMKIIEKNKKKTKEMRALEREIKIMKLISHPHIIYLHKVYECNKKIFLIIELCHGDLSRELKERKTFGENDTRKVIQDMLSAVAYLHKNDIVHRDLKLENILLAQNPRDEDDKLFIKITDFGLSVIRGGVGLDCMLQDFCGTLQYMSPELVLNRSYSHQCDLWAVGVIMYLLLTGKYPFVGSTNESVDLIEAICTQQPDVDFMNISLGAKDVIMRMLKKDPAIRITANEAAQHPWVLGRVMKQSMDHPENIIEMMKRWKEEFNPQHRNTRDNSLYQMPSFMKSTKKR